MALRASIRARNMKCNFAIKRFSNKDIKERPFPEPREKAQLQKKILFILINMQIKTKSFYFMSRQK